MTRVKLRPGDRIKQDGAFIRRGSAIEDQWEIIEFLSRPDAYGGRGATGIVGVDHRETHGAHVFLAGPFAWKIKRSVRFSYMDFSTLERRRTTLVRELELNRRFAPDLYLGLVAVTRQDDGSLCLGGDGTAVEWALQMRRFDEADLLDARAARGPFDDALTKALADAVVESHSCAEPQLGPGAAQRIAAVLDGVTTPLAGLAPVLASTDVAAFREAASRHLGEASGVLERRGLAGHVRRCHGDLHLGNIVVWHGKPTLFDALEFDETLATIDTLYDLAFLLMDLLHRGQKEAASLLLSRYLWRRDESLDIEGLKALPLLLAIRSAIRALVGAQRAAQLQGDRAADRQGSDAEEARRYLEGATSHLSVKPARLVAVGGLSGTGKSTLAAALAPSIGHAPGALHLRSDLERKSMLGVGETERLDARHYAPEVGREVYRRLLGKARLALAAGHSVIVDAVFAHVEERIAAAQTAHSVGAPFDGLWLSAPCEALLERVAARRGDASDATAAVVLRQLEQDLGAIDWWTIDASGGASETLARAGAVLGCGA
ncbi:MAG: AAA family ATPase [Hyphomicrobiaceae bacterium]|nr:AAA family ATPase [Hyphomicrobiaceae bacterium]